MIDYLLTNWWGGVIVGQFPFVAAHVVAVVKGIWRVLTAEEIKRQLREKA